MSAAEILIVAVVAAKYFQNHHERALCMLVKIGDAPPLSISRFNRRLHALSDWLYRIVKLLGKCSPAARCLSLIVCRCRCVNGFEPGAARKCADANIVAIVPAKKKSFSGGDCI